MGRRTVGMFGIVGIVLITFDNIDILGQSEASMHPRDLLSE